MKAENLVVLRVVWWAGEWALKMVERMAAMTVDM